MSHTLPELVEVLLKLVAKDNNAALLENPRILHGAFYNIKQKYERELPALEQMHFVTAGAFPYSGDLTETLDMLQVSGALSRENPSYERFRAKMFDDTPAWLNQVQRRVTGGDRRKEKALVSAVNDLKEALTA